MSFRRHPLPAGWGALPRALQSGLSSFLWAAARRRERPWLSYVAIPLAFMSSVLVGTYMAGPVLLLAPLLMAGSWWFAPEDPPWSWLLSVQSGCFGVLWAVPAITALQRYPAHRLVVAVVWIAWPLLIAVPSFINRRRGVGGY